MRKIHYIALLLLVCFLTGCAGEIEEHCSDQLPASWGCDQLPSGLYSCYKDRQFNLFQDTIENIHQPLRDTIQVLTDQVLDSAFSEVVQALLLLYITLYGVMLAGGLIDATMTDGLVRLMKVAFIALMFSEPGIQMYHDIVVKFAIDGGAEFLNWSTSKLASSIGDINTLGFQHEETAQIAASIQSATFQNTSASPINSGAFVAVDQAIGMLISPRSMALYSALFLSLNPTRWLIGGGLLLATFFFLLAIFRAVYIYVISLLGRVFLLGIGGIFAIFILFQQTQQIFIQKWVQQLLGYMFAPVFVFTFISMMSILINVAFLDIFKDENGEMKVRVCREAGTAIPFFGNVWPTWEFYVRGESTTHVTMQTGSNGMNVVVVQAGDWIPSTRFNNYMHVDVFAVLVLLGLCFMCWQTIPSLDELSVQLFGVLPDLNMKAKTKSLDIRHNIGLVTNRGKRTLTRYPRRAGEWGKNKSLSGMKSAQKWGAQDWKFWKK